MTELRAIATNGESYISESNYFKERWQQSYWGSNHARLAEIKRNTIPPVCFFCTQRRGLTRVEPGRFYFTRL
jgi:hypothetical protein